MFTFKIDANHMDPMNDPTKMKIIAEMINGFII